VQFLHGLSGEGARTGRDYVRHYRSTFPHLLDPVRAFERRHSNRGWPFYMVVDGKGTVRFARGGLLRDMEGEVRGLLDRLAPGEPARTVEYAGTRYIEKTATANGLPARRLVTSPCIARTAGGGLLTSYVTLRDGAGEVRVRTGETKEIPVAAGCADAYDAVMAAGADRTWIIYCGLAPSGKYDVYVRSLDGELALSEAVNLTASDDDAMGPDATIDDAGRLWVTYYRWHRMGTASRDKEVYARVFDGTSWSKEMRLSPADLPAYEDHTDPSIAPDPTGGVSVAWSWDMHRSRDPKYARYRQTYHAEAPTIFGRRLSAKDGPGDLLFLGHAGVDGAPELYRATDGRLWCAWNALYPAGRGFRKALLASSCAKGAKDRERRHLVEAGALDVCTPRFFEHDGALHVIWSSRSDTSNWRLMTSAFAEGEWSTPRVVEGKGDPRFVSVAADRDGGIRLAFVRDGDDGRVLVVKRLEFE
jgi:hypothetical protein